MEVERDFNVLFPDEFGYVSNMPVFCGKQAR